MGNRAVITTHPYSVKNVGIYVQWNGGRDSIEGFLKACKELGYCRPGANTAYAMARLTQVIATYFGGSLSIGLGTVRELGGAHCDNGTYVIGGDWEIVERKHCSPEWDEVNPDRTAAIAAEIVAALKENADK
jgi:hypothetical protein